jgi:hypothetical protein
MRGGIVNASALAFLRLITTHDLPGLPDGYSLLRTARPRRFVQCKRRQEQIIIGKTEQVAARAAPYISAIEHCAVSGECEASVDEVASLSNDSRPSEQTTKETIMSSKLMIVVTTISIVGSSIASGAMAASYHGGPRYFSDANPSRPADGAGYAAFGSVNRPAYGFGSSARPGHDRGFRRDSCGHIDDVCNSSRYF